MKYAPYSASRLATYEQCHRKFRFKYVDKVHIPFEPSLALTRGKILHGLLEWHGKCTLAETITKLQADKDVSESPFFNKAVLKECILIFKGFVETDMCKSVFADLELGTELQLGLDYKLEPCEYYGEEVLFRGLIDRVVVNKSENKVRIVDWKSGKDKSKPPYRQPPDQLMHYGSWYFSKFPVDEITLSYIFVEHNTELNYTIYRDKLNDYKKALLKPIISAEKNEVFPRNMTALCDYCDYRELCDEEGE